MGLSISSLTPGDIGNYTCSAAKDKLGSGHHTVELTQRNLLTVREKPEDTEAIIGDSVELACRVSSSVGRTNVTWWLGGEFAGEGEHLFLSNVTLEDSGNLTCRAANNETQLSFEASLKVVEEEEEVDYEDVEDYDGAEYDQEELYNTKDFFAYDE